MLMAGCSCRLFHANVIDFARHADRVASRARGPLRDEGAERLDGGEVPGEVLRLVHHDPELLLDGDPQLDEVERIEAEGALDPLGKRRVERDGGHAFGLELEAADEQGGQLAHDVLGFHHSSIPWQAAEKGPSAWSSEVRPSDGRADSSEARELAPLAARSTYTEYASRAAGGRRLASEPF